MSKLKTHLWILPRPFGAPAAAVGVLFGVALVGQWGWSALLAVAIGLLLMAFGHSMNSYLGWAWSKLDQGEPDDRSAEKPYTGGQSLLASGKVSLRGVLVNSLVWLVGALLLTAFFAARTTPWAWVPVLIAAGCPFWYEWAKLHWHPEIPLGLGFATAAAWLGMATSGQIDWWLGAVASLPLFLIWGVFAESIDQARDYGPNWPKGGRSLGLLLGHYSVPLRWAVAWFIPFVLLVQIFLVGTGFLSAWTAISFVSFIPFTLCAILIDTERSYKAAIAWGLAGITLYQIGMVLGEVLV